MADLDDADRVGIAILRRLLDDRAIEFVSTHGVSTLGPAVASFLLRARGRPSGSEFAAWLLDKIEVRDLYVDDPTLETVLCELWDPFAAQPSIVSTETRRADLEQLLLAEPNNLDHRAVYGDWLQAGDDRFGELITLQLAGDPELGPAAAYLREHGQALFGLLADYLGSVIRLRWRAGFIEAATIGRLPNDPESYEGSVLLAKLLEHRATMLVRELDLHPIGIRRGGQLGAMLEVALERPRPTLRRLTIDQAGWAVGTRLEPVRIVAERLPALEVLEVRVGDGLLDELRHPSLRRMVWDPRLLAKHSAAIARFDCAGLEHLEFGCAYNDPSLGDALAELELPRLRTLRLAGRPGLLDPLRTARWRDSLEVLDLSHGRLEDADIEALARIRFPRLRRLDLAGNQLGPEAERLATQLCAGVEARGPAGLP